MICTAPETWACLMVGMLYCLYLPFQVFMNEIVISVPVFSYVLFAALCGVYCFYSARNLFSKYPNLLESWEEAWMLKHSVYFTWLVCIIAFVAAFISLFFPGDGSVFLLLVTQVPLFITSALHFFSMVKTEKLIQKSLA